MVKVILAGHSLDRVFVEQMLRGELPPDVEPTPETISAAYARISRFPEDVNELRAQARRDVPAAKRSNSAIVFAMGHHSVAEHVQLNMDVLHLSRLAIEALEEARIGVAYTEKSQRYITLDGDFVTPVEFDDEERELFLDTLSAQVDLYKKAFPILETHQQKLHPDMLGTKSGRNTVEGWAKEDARYALGMAIEGQLGFSANARELEYIIRKLRHHPLPEVRDLSNQLLAEGGKVAPSLILLADPVEFEKATGNKVSDRFFANGRQTLEEATDRMFEENESGKGEILPYPKGDVTLLYLDEHLDDKVVAALLHTNSQPPRPYSECIAVARSMGRSVQIEYVREILQDLTQFDQLFREFEMGSFDFEAVLSSSCFAQLKRHRMMTLLKQAYTPSLGYTFPDAVVETGLQPEFKELLDRTSEAYERLAETQPDACEYVLTNAHRRRVLMNVNARELYHMARLRMDSHAQWDIRRLTGWMIELAKEVAPATMLLATGKDTFPALRELVYAK
ncbi:MAG: FAD-dependent thymidylate synthase [Nanoarchaeota archaeon]|nr:FAD-dependent thymidylate synthase [Nanoarchaeota archaeon]